MLGLGHDLSVFDKLLLVVAIAFGTINVVGGFLVTDRMLGMFKSGPGEKAAASQDGQPEDRELGDQVHYFAPTACLAPSCTISPPRVMQAPLMISSSKFSSSAPSSPVISSSSEETLRA